MLNFEIIRNFDEFNKNNAVLVFGLTPVDIFQTIHDCFKFYINLTFV